MGNLVLRIVYHTFECLVSRPVRIVFRKELGLFPFSGKRVWRCPLSLVFFFLLFSSGPRAYAPDALQPVGLLCYPSVLDVPTFVASPSPRPCYPRDPQQRKVELRGRESWPIILPKFTTSTEHLVIFHVPQIYDMGLRVWCYRKVCSQWLEK
jgi:hypothetical protein